MNTELYKKTLYTRKVKWIIHEIFEYDIAKANISILLQYGYISEREFNMYAQMNRMQRQIAIGRLQQNPTYSRAISYGFEQARKELVISNHIQDEDIVSIKKDAMYILNRLNVTDFGYIHFTLRGVYSIFLLLKGLEIYFYWDERTDEYDIQVKGISDDKLYLHEDFLSVICEILRYVQKGEYQNAIMTCIEFRQKYLAWKLPISYYREFSKESTFRLSNNYGVLDVDEKDANFVTPFYNDSVLLELHQILMEIAFSK